MATLWLWEERSFYTNNVLDKYAELIALWYQIKSKQLILKAFLNTNVLIVFYGKIDLNFLSLAILYLLLVKDAFCVYQITSFS